MIFCNAPELEKEIKGKFIFLDNNTLNTVFKDKETFSVFLGLLKVGSPALDPFTVFEFQRDNFDPRIREINQKMLNSEYFIRLPKNQELFLKIQTNALLLSRIFSKENPGNKSWDSIDLYIAGRIMLNYNSSVLITKDRRDFPPPIFQTVGLINLENDKGEVSVLAVLKFNKEKFDECYKNYLKLK